MIVETLTSFLDATSLGWASLSGLAAIIFVGLPHGAIDGAVAMALGWARKLWMMLAFVVGYVTMAALVVAFWLAFPDLALFAFLVISLVHFGLGDSIGGTATEQVIQTIAHGGLVIAGISLFHKAEVDTIFSYLTGGDTALIWACIKQAYFVIGLTLCIYIFMAIVRPAMRPRLIEIACLGFIFYVLPPLAGFAFYFCMVHTPRHLFRVWGQLSLQNFSACAMMTMAAAFTCASWLVGGVALWMIPDAMSVDAHLLRVIFIGLAALTVPHMLLVDGFFRRHQPATKVVANKMRPTGSHFQLDSGQDNNPQGHNDA